MIKKYNNLSLLYGIPGFILQIFIFSSAPTLKILGLFGLVLFIIGFAYYAKGIGRHPAWGLLGLLGWIGVIIIICLKDKTLTPQEAAAPRRISPILIGALTFLLLLIIFGILSAIFTK